MRGVARAEGEGRSQGRHAVFPLPPRLLSSRAARARAAFATADTDRLVGANLSAMCSAARNRGPAGPFAGSLHIDPESCANSNLPFCYPNKATALQFRGLIIAWRDVRTHAAAYYRSLLSFLFRKRIEPIFSGIYKL